MGRHLKIISTVCYIRHDGKWLMLYRNKLDSHNSRRSFRGLGGKSENGESPIDCVKREIKEEAGIDIEPIWKGVVTFSSSNKNDWETHVFIAEGFRGELIECSEGELSWVDESEVPELDMPEGDRILIPLLFKDRKFHAHLRYGDNKNLVESKINFI